MNKKPAEAEQAEIDEWWRVKFEEITASPESLRQFIEANSDAPYQVFEWYAALRRKT